MYRLLVVSLLLMLAFTPYAAASDIATVGDAAAVATVLAAGGITLARDDKEGIAQFVKSNVLAVPVTMGLKYSIHERRPDGSDNHSFPSAHTSISFTSAEYLRKRYGWDYGLPAYALASFVAYSRVEANKHHVKDVIAGAAIGIGSSYIFTSPNHRYNFSVEVDPGYYGVRMTRLFD
ncbi:MAG: phosphatase PAP2 family protein [Geobacter sp.]|nr:phosphatase PAP2 family protein [Geobacter sp.]